MAPSFAIRGATQYPIILELQYTTRDRPHRVGMGWTSLISSRDVVFSTDQPMEKGTKLEISISWPVLLHGQVPLKVVVESEVADCVDKSVTARIVKYQFRTRRIPAAKATAQAVAAPHQAAAALYQNQEALYAR
jgi:hypothetical protein